ncbi:phosphatidylinositol 3-kinase regulatory subunit beta-like [Dreissena polymorpha]|uniref:phosphatidylinositol 3-kinase regulatory subunit beta-like n=1 Tax=Dreissena polymorpha TaxID=45954 RepID=UPI002264C263|nr:phosphatidylinositol 3-kinase regulatory subunit beta-like [Dreissena polymorpha]
MMFISFQDMRVNRELCNKKGVQDCEWYRGQIGKKEAIEELKSKPPGTFLGRQASTNTAQQGGSLHMFTLVFVDEHGRIKKLMIMKTGDINHFKQCKECELQAFETVSDLVAEILIHGF